jgi:Glyoxalase-like domain
VNEQLDHILWAVSDLEEGSARFAALSGVRPVYGGVHASGQTHNALVRLGERCYLEVLAPVGKPAAQEDAFCRLARSAIEPRVVTYCMRSARPLAEVATAAAARGWERSVVLENGRVTPQGTQLRWRWLGPSVPRFGLGFPFFIDWLDSPHPAETLLAAVPAAEVRLRRFAVGHPEAAALAELLQELGSPVATFEAESLQFRVELDTPRGPLVL